MDTVGMILVTMPIFMPVVISMKIDPVYFGIMVLINMALDGLTPPVGMMLYVVKAVALRIRRWAMSSKRASPSSPAISGHIADPGFPP